MTAHYNNASNHARQPSSRCEKAPAPNHLPDSQPPKARSWDDLWLTTQVLERLTPCLHPDEVLDRLPEVVRDLFPHDAGVVATIESPAPAKLKIAQVYGFNGATAALADRIALNQLIRPWTPADGPLHVPDLAETPLQVADLFSRGGMRSLLSIPVGASDDGETEWLLILAHRRPGGFAEIDPATLAQFQRAVAIPLRNARQVAEHHQRNQDLLGQTGRLWEIVTAAPNPAAALAQLLDTALAIAEADAGTIMIVVAESNELYVRASRGMRTRASADLQLPWGTRSAAPLQHIDATLWIRPLQTPDKAPTIPSAAVEELQTYLGLPWRSTVRGDVVGLLNLYWRSGAAELDPERMAVLNSLGRAGVVLLEQSTLRDFSANCDRLISQFQAHKAQTISLMSHQLRTPITAVSGFAQLLLRRSPDATSPIARYAQTIQAECKRLNVLVDNVLELSRLEGSLITLQMRPFSLLPLLQELHSDPLLRDQMEGGVLTWDLPDHLPIVVGDPLRLKQALLALLRRDDGHPLPSGRTRHVMVHVLETPPAVEVALDTADTMPVAASLDELLAALDLQQVIDSQVAREAELPLYAAFQFLRAMGAGARKEQDTVGQARYVVTLPVLEES